MAEFRVATERLVLRDWRDEDGEPFFRALNTPEVMHQLGGVQTRAGWRESHARLMAFPRRFGHGFWIVEERASGRLLGFCGLKRVDAPGAGVLAGVGEIGWRLRASAWGQGFAKEAAIAALDLGFARFGYPRIVALTTPDNLASQGLMRRLGMERRPALDYVDRRFGPAMNPMRVFALAAADWPAARASALAPKTGAGEHAGAA